MVSAWYGWRDLPTTTTQNSAPTVRISIIIAARNETQNLPKLLVDLSLQNFPSEQMEIIVIDDHSDTPLSSLSGVIEYAGQNLRVLDLPTGKQGKKQALLEGVNCSKGELLLFTDADCRVSPLWVSSYAEIYFQERPGLILGLVDYPIQKGLFQIFSRFDFLSLIITGAGFARLKRPVMCNGANLAVRKDLYLKSSLQIKNRIFSGDDIFLLHAVKKLKDEKISVLKSIDSIVISNSPDNFRDFMNQRIRWASKSKHYSDKDTIALALLVFFSNIILVFSIILFLVTNKIQAFAIIIIIKTIADFLILDAGLRFFGGFKYLVLLPLFELVYPIYILFVFFGGLFMKISWKGRII